MNNAMQEDEMSLENKQEILKMIRSYLASWENGEITHKGLQDHLRHHLPLTGKACAKDSISCKLSNSIDRYEKNLLTKIGLRKVLIDVAKEIYV
jgi:hypothetical protein